MRLHSIIMCPSSCLNRTLPFISIFVITLSSIFKLGIGIELILSIRWLGLIPLKLSRISFWKKKRNGKLWLDDYSMLHTVFSNNPLKAIQNPIFGRRNEMANFGLMINSMLLTIFSFVMKRDSSNQLSYQKLIDSTLPKTQNTHFLKHLL